MYCRDKGTKDQDLDNGTRASACHLIESLAAVIDSEIEVALRPLIAWIEALERLARSGFEEYDVLPGMHLDRSHLVDADANALSNSWHNQYDCG